MSGTSPSFNHNEFTKDQAEYWTAKDGGFHFLWALKWSWLSGWNSTQPVSEHGTGPMSSTSGWGWPENILCQITRIKLTAVQRVKKYLPFMRNPSLGFIHSFGIFLGSGLSNPSRSPWCNSKLHFTKRPCSRLSPPEAGHLLRAVNSMLPAQTKYSGR